MAELPRTSEVVDRLYARGAAGVQVLVHAEDGRSAELVTGTAAPDRPLDGKTVLPWLCAGKPMLGVLCLQLAVEGRLDLDAPISDLLAGPADWAGITVRHLLTHKAGLDEPEAGDGLVGRPAGSSDFASWRKATGFLPGGDWHYSPQWNWLLVEAIVREIVGREPADLLRERFFGPLGLDSVSVLPGADELLLRYRVPSPGGRAWLPADFPVRDPKDASSRLAGTLADLASWYQVMLGVLRADGGVLPSSVLWDAIRLRPPTNSGVEVCSEGYGVGFMVGLSGFLAGRHCSAWSFGHLGGLGSSMLVSAFADPEPGIVVAAVVNSVSPGTIHGLRALGTAIYEDLGAA